MISHHMTLRKRKEQNRTSNNIISYHIISYLSNTDTRWCCSCYRYSDSDIIDLSTRDTSRHHITTNANAILNYSHSQSAVTVQDKIRQYRTVLSSYWWYVTTGRPKSDISRTNIDYSSSLLLLLLLLLPLLLLSLSSCRVHCRPVFTQCLM